MKEKVIIEAQIEKGDFERGGEVSSNLKEKLRKLGVEPGIIRKTAIVTYELEMNVIIHSEGGIITVSITTTRINIKVRDHGPGIEDLEKAFRPGYSTATEEIRELGFGAGMGLSNVKRYSNDLDIKTGSDGTCIKAVMYF